MRHTWNQGLLATGLFFLGLMSGQALARQPHMQAALESLSRAESQLKLADLDKGGHRKKALELVQQAKAEVQAGIVYDRRK